MYKACECAKRIQQLRRMKGYTQEVAAEKFQISVSTLQRIESGRQSAPIDLLVSMGEEYEVSLDYLLKGENQVEGSIIGKELSKMSETQLRAYCEIIQTIQRNVISLAN